ncbi:MAG: DNA/RNA nuclease SfsA [Clostridia bacterium]|nr:DNA/RNA nuclease SfsA [Clostridia bacterium]MBQ1435412.1 DNA/RNA nuclease SfsA [Clostridia bacterium]MBQ4248799.1 DNA/RNA nuclease SfsA [Clostridia bacterium]
MYIFKEPLSEGVIEKRQSRFTMLVTAEGQEGVLCHCPTTGRIGNIELSGRPCLLSRSGDPKRKTRYTAEAVSLCRPGDGEKTWIGINQNAANRYVEHYIKNGGFSDMLGVVTELRREVFLGESKLDFLAGNTYLEVKTPLQSIQAEIPEWVRTKKTEPFSSTGRMQRHITELSESLKAHERAVMLVCFIYDNPGFRIVERSENYEEVKKTVDDSVAKGVEIWQANFEITPVGVGLKKYFPIHVE